MAQNETRVTYKAVANFIQLSNAARKAKKDLADLQKQEAALNAQGLADEAAGTAAANRRAKAIGGEAAANKSYVSTIRDKVVAFKDEEQAADAAKQATTELGAATSTAEKVAAKASETIKKQSQSTKELGERARSLAKDQNRAKAETGALGRAFDTTYRQAKRLDSGLERVGNWRPRLTPPFIALVPIIGGVLALINPLVAGLGAAGAAALGLGSNIASLGGLALGAIPGITALLSVVGALKVAFGGIGGAFKAFSAQQKAGGGGGGGGGGGASKPIEITQTEKITRAQEALANATQDVTFAEQDLDDARKTAIQRLKDLQKAVDRAAQSEASARAQAAQAQQDYNNVLADPASTKADKDAAKAALDDATNNVQDVIDENIQNQKDLADAKAKGVEGDRQVIQAQRQVTAAYNSQRDAQIALQNAIKGTGEAAGGAGGGGGGVDLFQQALDKLSPSAKSVVLQLIAMKDQWDALQKTVQESFFSEVVGDIQLLNKLFPVMTKFLSEAAGAAGRVADKFLKMVTSDQWLKDLNTIGEQNVPIIENIGDGLLSILDVFKSLSVIAGPLLIKMSAGFAKSAKGLSDLLNTDSERTKLAGWLDKVYGRLQQWWRIVKNIGMTLFNYGKASSGFGQWLTDGFEKITKGWRDASEAANKDDSPFKKYLEDIKPLLTEIKGLIGDFFKWLGKTMGDKSNITTFKDIVSTIRTRLGPALSDIFDILSKSGVGNNIVDAISSVVEAIDTFLKNGGVEGIKAFWNTVKLLARIFETVVNIFPAPVFAALATSLGIIAALRFVGATKFLSLLLKAAASGKLSKLMDALPGFLGGASTKTPGKHVGPKSSGRVSPGVSAGLIGAAVAAAVAGIAETYPGVVKANGDAFSTAGKINAQKQPVTRGEAEDRDASNKKAKDKAFKGLGDNLATAGSAGTVGVLKLIDSAAGTNLAEPFKSWLQTTLGPIFTNALKGIGEFFTQTLPGWWQGRLDLFTEGWDQIVQWFKDVGQNISDWWQGVIEGVQTIFVNIYNWWQGVLQGISDGWTGFTTWLQGVWDGFLGWLRGIWNGIQQWWNGVIQTARDIWGRIQGWWSGVVNTAAQIWSNIQTWWSGVINTAAGIWGTIQSRFKSASDTASGIWSTIQGWFRTAANGITTAWNNVLSFFHIGGKASGGAVGGGGKPNSAMAKGGRVRRGYAVGGKVIDGRTGQLRDAGTDTVPTMLTPGEFVLRKAVVNSVGVDNLTALNDGLITYAQLLQNAMAQPQNKSKSKPGSAGMGFQLGNIVPDMPRGFYNGGSATSAPKVASASGGDDSSMSIGTLVVNNPVPEPVSESLPRSIRKLSYLKGR